MKREPEFGFEFGLRDALRRLDDALTGLHNAILAARGFHWEVWDEPTHKGSMTFAWRPARLAGPFADKAQAEEAWYEHHCEARRVPDWQDYHGIKLRETAPP